MNDDEFDKRVRKIVREELAELLDVIFDGITAAAAPSKPKKKSGRGVARYPKMSRDERDAAILRALERPAPSITEVARRIGRPLDSMLGASFSSLEDRGLIEYSAVGWRRKDTR